MSIIRVLDKTIYNRIAAGEVVERPASVVKELVENAIDAGARQIDVEITEGGLKRIFVADDGGGIERSYLKTAFFPHATSKISAIDDLDGIATLGFRGEALASIASVAMVNVKTKAPGSGVGAEISVKGGEFSDITDCGCADGTAFLVENLFFNAPVRAKFLKSARGEEGEVSDLMSRFVLSNPHIRFTYKADGKQIYLSQGKDLLTAVHAVYGDNVLGNIIEAGIKGADGYNIFGYIGKPSYPKPNRTYQTLIINGRVISSPTVSASIQNAYGSYLMKRQFPFFVLELTMPLSEVDVNVHPNKREVRFANSKKVYGLFYNACKNALSQCVTFEPQIMPQQGMQHQGRTISQELPPQAGASGAGQGASPRLTDGAPFPQQSQQPAGKYALPESSRESGRLKGQADGEASASLRSDLQPDVDFLGKQSENRSGNAAPQQQKSDEMAQSFSEGQTYKMFSRPDAGIGGNPAGSNKFNVGFNKGEDQAAAGGGQDYTVKSAAEQLKDIAAAAEAAEAEDWSPITPVEKKQYFVADSGYVGPSEGSAESGGVAGANAHLQSTQAMHQSAQATFRSEAGFQPTQAALYADTDKTTQEPLLQDTYSFKFCGQLFSAYLIVEYKDNVLFIDQHAAHERLLYDKLLEQQKASRLEIQQLLLPFIVHVNAREYGEIEPHLDAFRELGFDIDGINNAFKVSAVPMVLADIDLKAFFDSTSGDLLSGATLKENAFLKHRIAARACKSAIKAGQKLEQAEVLSIINKLAYSGTELLCPHGRPILIRYTKRDIEKLFKRIV